MAWSIRRLNEARGELVKRQDEAGFRDMWVRPIAYMRLQHGQLFTPDPLQAALRRMLNHPRFQFFDPERGFHLPLPVEVVHLERTT